MNFCQTYRDPPDSCQTYRDLPDSCQTYRDPSDSRLAVFPGNTKPSFSLFTPGYKIIITIASKKYLKTRNHMEWNSVNMHNYLKEFFRVSFISASLKLNILIHKLSKLNCTSSPCDPLSPFVPFSPGSPLLPTSPRGPGLPRPRFPRLP